MKSSEQHVKSARCCWLQNFGSTATPPSSEHRCVLGNRTARALRHFGPLVLALLGACAWRDAQVDSRASDAVHTIQIREEPPPAGATPLGSLSVTHGEGCGVFGRNGTREGIEHALRTEATKRRANFVQLIELEEPHMTRDCFDHVFRARALAFQVQGQPVAPRTCTPPCSPGYQCNDGTCTPLCNPACPAGQVCRLDRTCGPAGR